MGGERFETVQPEMYLFGENQDLNYLGSRPVPVGRCYLYVACHFVDYSCSHCVALRARFDQHISRISIAQTFYLSTRSRLVLSPCNISILNI